MNKILALMVDYDPTCETLEGTQKVGEPDEIFD
jgi:hypothetical protein